MDSIKRLKSIWHNMNARCNATEKTHKKNYEAYVSKGITVCDEWKDFDNFVKWAFTHNYDDDLTLDRVDVFGNYEPSNCRWVSLIIQANNKINTVQELDHFKLRNMRIAKELKQADVADELKISQKTLSAWETGRNEPNLSSVVKLCDYFDCSLFDLTGIKAYRPKDINFSDMIVRIQTLDEDELLALSIAITNLLDFNNEERVMT